MLTTSTALFAFCPLPPQNRRYSDGAQVESNVSREISSDVNLIAAAASFTHLIQASVLCVRSLQVMVDTVTSARYRDICCLPLIPAYPRSGSEH
jgi:hypothetical protein